jgi:uncharacterized membrane protein YeaQ/YmgE (transglycosylase-associated protein family)
MIRSRFSYNRMMRKTIGHTVEADRQVRSRGTTELIMGILGWIIVGGLMGALAKAIMPGRDPGGIIVTIIIGIVGGLLGGWIGSALFGVSTGSFFDIRTWLIALVGALILLGIYRAVVGRRHVTR